MKRLKCGVVACNCLLALLRVDGVGAQSDDSMGQGQASIAVRSDVKLSVKGTGGTTSERLSKLGQAVADQMGEIRACYRKQVATSPTVIAALRVRITLDKGDRPSLELTDSAAPADAAATSSKELNGCVSRALEKGHYKDVGRPAAALLALEFDNSRARGQAQMVERKSELGRAEAHDDANGKRRGVWSSDGGQLKFTVEAAASLPADAVDLVVRGFQGGYAAFLDCRRKCEKGGTSPEGDIDAELSLDRQGRSTVRLGTITVAHERAPACAERAFKRLQFDKPVSPLQVHVAVHFAP
jgi:hypothetical protein